MRLLVVGIWFAASAPVALGVGPVGSAYAQQAACRSGCVCESCRGSAWQAYETENFRCLWRGKRDDIQEIGRQCETLRESLHANWFGAKPTERWTPKCDVVLHADDAGYLRQVGAAGRNTVASALVSDRSQKTKVRRVDVRRTNQHWHKGPFAHELTHVVLADRLDLARLPRWADEGMATLADSTAKQQRHQHDLAQAFQRGTAFRLGQLLSASDYPAQDQWGTFYGQSVSLVKFLVERDSPTRFVEFLETAHTQGYASALQSVYQIADVATLERQWRLTATQNNSTAVAKAE